MTKVKICGITNLKDAEIALEAGADALGFVFATSPRQISAQEAAKIIKKTGPWTASVGVFVNETSEKITQIVLECGLSAVQLHGDESPLLTKRLSSFKVIKAFRVGKDFKTSETRGYSAQAYLFDTKVKDLFGGSGKSFDWKILKNKKWDKPIILSGGLHPKNVNEAIRLLKPYGVDVSSGVERSAGKKDSKLVKEFIRNAKKAL